MGEIDSLLENDVTNNPENTDDTVQDFDEFFNAESSDEIEFSEESDAVDQTVEEKFEADEDVPSISEEDISDDLEVDTKPETETSVKASQQNEISSTKENKAKKHINDDDIFETTQEDIDSLFG